MIRELNREAIFHSELAKKGGSKMNETDDEALKAEIEEIMSKVDTIMDKVARVIPGDSKETNGREFPDRAS
jgi:hypothetical protein